MTGESKAFDDAKEILPPIISFISYKNENFEALMAYEQLELQD